MARRIADEAVALRYDATEDVAPKIVAKGSDALAAKMIEIAEAHGVPIHQDKNLVKILSLMDLNDEIPQNVYFAVAEILSFLYRAGKTRF